MSAPRLPFDPVDEHAARVMGQATTKGLARRLDVFPRTVDRWRDHGLTVWQADTVAVRLGRFPAELWPEWETVADVEAAAELARQEAGGGRKGTRAARAVRNGQMSIEVEVP